MTGTVATPAVDPAAASAVADPAAATSTITLDTDTPVVATPEPAKVVEPTPEEKAAEETRRAALTDEQRAAEDAAKAVADANKAPEKYEDFKVPEGVKLIPEITEEFKGLAKELNLSQDAAQKVADIGAKLSQKWATDQQALVTKAQTEWAAQSRADKEFGGEKLKENIAVAEGAIQAFTSPALRTLLKESGLANHPEMIRTFFRIGKQIKADTTERGSDPGAGNRDESYEARAARLYGQTTK